MRLILAPTPSKRGCVHAARVFDKPTDDPRAKRNVPRMCTWSTRGEEEHALVSDGHKLSFAYRICVFLIRGGVNPAMPNDWYAILEVEPSATSSDIRSAYRKQALRSHPDRAQTDDKDQATAQFKLVAEYVFLDQGVY